MMKHGIPATMASVFRTAGDEELAAQVEKTAVA